MSAVVAAAETRGDDAHTAEPDEGWLVEAPIITANVGELVHAAYLMLARGGCHRYSTGRGSGSSCRRITGSRGP